VARDSNLKVVRGNPTPEELAALIVALAVRDGKEIPEDPPMPAISAWIDRAGPGRRTSVARPGAWRLSGWAP
jgi:hypothetical protein